MKTLLFTLLLIVAPNIFSQDIPEKFTTYFLELDKLSDEEKLDNLNDKISKNPKELWYYYYRALVHCTMDNTESAIADLNEILSIEPDFAYAHARLGQIIYEINPKNFEEALEYVNMAIELEPTDFWNYGIRSSMYLDEGQYEEALEDAKKVVEMPGGDYTYGGALMANIYIASGEIEDLKVLLNKYDPSSLIKSMVPDNCLFIGDVYLKMGEKKKACKCYNHAANIYTIMETEIPSEVQEKLKVCK